MIWLTGDNTEKMWVHQFLAKPKMIAAGGLGGGGWRPRQCLGEGVGAKPQNNSFCIKHTKTLIVRVNIG